MEGTDQLWWAAPGLALRVEPLPAFDADPADGWQLNPAAQAWSAQAQVSPAQWAALAHDARAALRAGAVHGQVHVGQPPVELRWTGVPLREGWLVWLDAEAAQADRLRQRLAEVQDLARMGTWERDLLTGAGHWDEPLRRMLEADAADGVPAFDISARHIHPDDRERVLCELAQFGRQVGRHETRFRIITRSGVVKDVHAALDVQGGPTGQPERMLGVLIDETEAASRLRDSEAVAAKWMRAVDLAAVALWRLDLNTNEVYFSEWGYRMLGLDPQRDRLTVEQLRERIHPDDRAAVAAAAEEAASKQRVVDVEARYRHANGSYRHLVTRRVAERDAQGRLVGLSGVTLDMTERIQERERAQVYAQRIDRITNAAGVGIWSMDVETQQIEWNDQMYRLYGLPRSEPPPGNRRWLGELVHPDDREIARNHRPVVGTGPQGLHAEFRIVRPDGAVRWVAAWSRREVLGGHELAFGINLDITALQRAQTELRQMQERVRLATESAGIGTWERDLRTGRAKWDAQMYRLRGLPVGPETPPDDSRYAAYHPDDLERIKRHKAQAASAGDGYENEFRVVLPDGSIRWLATRGLVKRDAHGQPERMLGVTWDVTERRRAEQALREKAAAEQASEAKSQFLARMSHELRTPLNAVLGFAQLMDNDAADPLSALQRERVDRIHTAGLHLLALIDDVLDLATIESDAMPLACGPVSLQAALDDVLQWTQLQAAQAQVSVQAGAMPGWVRGDPRRVRQVLSNLVSNAIKYNRPHGQVWVSCEPCTYGGQDGWALAVRDTGCGLTDEQRAQLFQPFNRLGAERGAIQGTGIGLAIVHHLVRRMGGEVEVGSQPGQGSEFRVLLHADAPHDASDHAPLSGYHTDTLDSGAGHRLQVLYIEDNPVNVLLVQELLALRSDVQLSVAVDGESGVKLALQTRPHVVLIDMQLPDIDGFEVLRRLRAAPEMAGVSIVALSANAMPDDVNRALKAGFDDYWTKPIDFTAFLRALSALAQQHQVA